MPTGWWVSGCSYHPQLPPVCNIGHCKWLTDLGLFCASPPGWFPAKFVEVLDERSKEVKKAMAEEG